MMCCSLLRRYLSLLEIIIMLTSHWPKSPWPKCPWPKCPGRNVRAPLQPNFYMYTSSKTGVYRGYGFIYFFVILALYHGSLVVRKLAFCIWENKDAVTAKLISTFVFATQIVKSLYFLNTKFQASSHLLWLYSPVCVGPSRKPQRPVFLQ